MKVIISQHNQSIIDLTIEAYGNMEGYFDLLVSNPAIGLDTTLMPGTQLTVVDVPANPIEYAEKNRFTENPIDVITVDYHQSIIDLIVQETGSIEGLFPFIQYNGIGLNTKPIVGTPLRMKANMIADSAVQRYFKRNKLKVNTSSTNPTLFGGIGSMKIGTDFVVSG